MKARTFAIALAVAGLTIATSITAVVPAEAATVTGVTNGKYGSAQAVAVNRSPAFPTCTAGMTSTYDLLTVSGFYSGPFSDATGGAVPLGTNYLMVQANPDVMNTTSPWRLALYNSSGAELRWDGFAWITAPAGGFTTEQLFSSSGQIYGASSSGFLYVSTARGFGLFVQPNGGIPTDPYSYTPNASLNTCVSSIAIAAGLDQLSVSDVPTAGSPGSTGGGTGGGTGGTTYKNFGQSDKTAAPGSRDRWTYSGGRSK